MSASLLARRSLPGNTIKQRIQHLLLVAGLKVPKAEEQERTEDESRTHSGSSLARSACRSRALLMMSSELEHRL